MWLFKNIYFESGGEGRQRLGGGGGRREIPKQAFTLQGLDL